MKRDSEDQIVLGATLTPWSIVGLLTVIYYAPDDPLAYGIWGVVAVFGVVVAGILCFIAAVLGVILVIEA